ncbi:MAG TPA: DUF58 domain-containing protein [Campylobacterales bacterium]|nr:DUF58 domain-containing protein [Campylobacterales bacterium]
MDTKLQEILFKARKNVFSNLTSDNLTKLRGDGMDLRDIKAYEYGDDIRHINWRATAKGEEIRVNIFDEYKELNILTVFLSSSTINFGSKTLKQDNMAEILAYILYSSIKNKDKVESLFFTKTCDKNFNNIKNIAFIDDVISYALEFDTNKKEIDYKEVCSYINEHYKRGHIVVFIGDFLDKVDFTTLSKKHQTLAIIVRDHLEESLEFSDEVMIKSPQSGKSEEFFINSSIKKRYQELILSHDNELYAHLQSQGIDFKKIYNDDVIYLKLMELFR